MILYVVNVTRSGSTRVSGEAYRTLAAAQKFIINRAGHPRLVYGDNGYKWEEQSGAKYEIFEVRV